MPAPTFLALVSGAMKRMTAAVSSAADSIVATGADGKIDASFMPSGFGQNTKATTAGEALAANDLVYFDSTGKALKADATVAGKAAVGFVKASAVLNAACTVYLSGNTITGLSGLTPGTRQFLSKTAGGRVEAGGLATYSAGNIVQKIGDALSATEIAFEPEEPIEL